MSSFDSIGGYFGLHINYGRPFYTDLISLNSGRNALEYILLSRGYKKIYLPFFTCDVLLEPLRKYEIECEFYRVNERLEPVHIPVLNKEEAFLYTNYFGVKSNYIRELQLKTNNLILDYAQAFFCRPSQNVDTFYSPRKFFGLPDGAYVSINKPLETSLKRDFSVDRCSHLLLRLDVGAESGYQAFKINDDALTGEPIKRMSKLTEALLSGIDYEWVRVTRNDNFNFLHQHLQNRNQLTWIDESLVDGPMVYPFYCRDKTLREKLIANKIFVATYWPNVFKWVSNSMLEYELAQNIIPLPVDQRYQLKDMIKIINLIGCNL